MLRWLALLMLSACAAQQPAARGETVPFISYTPASQKPLITNTFSRDPVTISGTLTMPIARTFERNGKVPAVVILHGSGGISADREGNWARRFNEWGVAAFVVDSFTARGVKQPFHFDSPHYFHTIGDTVDGYRAL